MLLFLLFSLALYQFVIAGFNAFAIVCLIPALVVAAIVIFKWRMSAFWLLITINYFLQWKCFPSTGIPMSLYNEILQILLLGIAIIDARQAKGLSQKELAEITGIKQPAIARLENGHISPSVDTINKLLAPLGKRLAVIDA